MMSETEKLLYDSMMDCYNKGIEIGEITERARIEEEKQELRRLLHRNFHVVFRPFCLLFGHRFDPLWCVCKICKMTELELYATTAGGSNGE